MRCLTMGRCSKKKGYACVGITSFRAQTTATATVTGQELVISSIPDFANRNVIPSSVSISILASLNNTVITIPLRDNVDGTIYDTNDDARSSIGNIIYSTGKITLNIPASEGNPQAQSPVIHYSYYVGEPATGIAEVGTNEHLFLMLTGLFVYQILLMKAFLHYLKTLPTTFPMMEWIRLQRLAILLHLQAR